MASITMATTVDTNNEKGKTIASEQDYPNMPKLTQDSRNDAALPRLSFFHVYNAYLETCFLTSRFPQES